MSSLNFSSRVILASFLEFYKEKYQPNSEHNTDEHVKAQKLFYFLEVFGINSFNYSYVWDDYGPYSEGLQNNLFLLDRSNNEIDNFYDKYSEDVIFSNTFVKGALFKRDNKKMINELAANLKIDEHEDSERNWVELLASLIYLSNSVMPGVDCEIIKKELKRRKSQFINEEINEAWNVLNGLNIVSNH